MTQFWLFGPDLTSMKYLGRLMDKRPAAYEVSFDVAEHQRAWNRQQQEMARSGDVLPLGPGERAVPVLTVRDGAFPLDLFQQNGLFASAFAREVLKPAEPHIQYLPVDSSPSSPNVVERRVEEVRVLARRPIFDHAQTTYREVSVGEAVSRLPIRKIRPDAHSDAAIFIPEGDGRLFVTDAFAHHLMGSGLKGIAFRDIETREEMSVPISGS